MKSVTFGVLVFLGLLPTCFLRGRLDPGIDRIPLPILRRRKAPFFSGRFLGREKCAEIITCKRSNWCSGLHSDNRVVPA